MRYRARRDLNSRAIIACYMACGASWANLAAVGQGVPDGAVGLAGVTDLVEIKNPETRGQVQPNQIKWHRLWRGSTVRVVRTLDDVQSHVADMRRRSHAAVQAVTS